MRRICSHHICCMGDLTIPYAKLAARCLEEFCPPELRDDLRIFIHLDALSDPPAAAEWLRSPRTEVTTGMIGLAAGTYIPGRYHQVMFNRVSEEFAAERTIAFVDADLFLVDASWFAVAQTHDPERHYARSCGFRGDNRLVVTHRGSWLRSISTKLFTLTPSIHNDLHPQRHNADNEALGALQARFPDISVSLRAPHVDSMMVSSVEAQLRGLEVVDVSGKVNAAHIGSISSMRAQKIRTVTARLRATGMLHLSGGRELGLRALARAGRGGWLPASLKTRVRDAMNLSLRLDSWLSRVRLNARALDLPRSLGWGAWIDSQYEAQIQEMAQAIARDKYCSGRQRNMPATPDEIAFSRLVSIARHWRAE